MAANPTASNKTILTRSEDWEQWFKDLQANVSEQIWPYINPELPEKPLLKEPVCQQPEDIERNAQTYAALSAANQKIFENARRFFDQDLKLYTRQIDQLLAARAYITATVSPEKRTVLESNKTVREWIQMLKDELQPEKEYMSQQAK